MLHRLRLGRRLLFAGSLGALGVASGCDLLDRTAPSGPSGTTSETADLTPDEALIDQVTTALALAAALGEATSARFRRLRRLSRPFVTLHESHGTMLGGLPQVEPPSVRPRLGKARSALLSSERRLQQTLVRSAMAAESGALAQTFASMAAAVAQQRAVIR